MIAVQYNIHFIQTSILARVGGKYFAARSEGIDQYSQARFSHIRLLQHRHEVNGGGGGRRLRMANSVCFVEYARTCRICSRSSANASATEAIQNCLNRFRRACSSWARPLDPSGGKNGRASAGGGEGEGSGDWRRSRA
jgi:hypothetical protein